MKREEASSMRKTWAAVCLAACVAILAGCAAGSAPYHEGMALVGQGQYVSGFEKLEEAVRLAPQSAQYRIALANQRASVVHKQLIKADEALREGRLSEAEEAYRQVLLVDGQNTMARQGQETLVQERRHRLVLAEVEPLIKKGTAPELAQALDKLRTVLAENPSQRSAQILKARAQEAQARLPKPGARLSAAFQKPITLEFRDAPLKSVFDVIAKVSGLNFFFDREIRPDLKATILAKNTSIEDAVRLLLATSQLEQKVLSDNAILIFPNTPQKLKDYQTLTMRTFYLANADVKAVSNSIKTIVKTKDMVVDERLGIIMMRDTPDAVRMAERIVALQDLRDPEVMLEVEVLEVKRSRLLELGVQWPSQLGLAPLSSATSPLTLTALRNLNSSTIQATTSGMLINARKEDQDGNILANPRIRVKNKEKAKILIGDRVPVITTTSTSTGFVAESVNYVDVGLKLDVEPNIYLDDEVAIKVNLEVSSLVKEVVSKSGSLSYQIGTRGANTVLRLKDGETQILAGLISDEDRSTANKVPLLGEIPILGRLFGSQKDDTQRSEILLSITPRVVRSLTRPDLTEAEFESGTESSIGADPLMLRTVDAGGAGAAAGSPMQPTVASAGAPMGSTALAAPGSAVSPAMSASGQGGAPATGLLVGAGAVVGAGASPSAQAAAAATPGAAGAATLSWQAPAQIKAGEQFTAVLRINAQTPLRGLPLLLAFDPQLLQVVSVQEGDFLKQAGGNTQFSQRVDAANGKVFVAVVRQNASGTDAGVNGLGGVVSVTFKALKPSTAQAMARVQVLSFSPEPQLATPVSLPLEQAVRVLP
jgi:general secretion pathway protein D